MDFGALPPEINSGLMYSGPGSGSMLAAAAAWDGLAADLQSTATSYSSEVTGLAGQWQGPSSAAMTAAVSPYIGWMNATSAQAEQAATQARAAAAAYEAAHAMTVPPPVIAANRSLLMMLVATNFLGQNTPAIAATEAHYAEMWAQDAAAMYGYAASSAAASQLTPFSTPPQTANPLAASGGETLAAGTAGATIGSSETQAALTQLTAAVPPALQSMAAPLAASSAGSDLGTSSMLGLTSLMMPLRMATMPLMMLSRLAMMGGMGGMMGGAKTMSATTGGLGSAVAGAGGLPAGVLTSAGAGSAGLTAPGGLGTLVASSAPAAPVSASLGRALPVGALSVPQGWGAAAPAVTLTSATSPMHGLHAPSATGSGMVPPVLPMSPMTGRGIGDNTAPRLDPRPTVIARSPLGG